MSRQIDLTQPLSDEDKQYLEDRDDRRSLDLNALHLMGGGVDEEEIDTDPATPATEPTTVVEDDPEETEVESYKGWRKPQWEAEVARRNESREEDAKIAPAEWTAKGLKEAILADDAKSAGE